MALSRLFNDPFFQIGEPFFTGAETSYPYSAPSMQMQMWPFEGSSGQGRMERAGVEQQLRPRCDVWEDNQAYHIRAELPGMGKENCKVDVTGDTLTIRGDVNQEEEKEGTNWHRRERRRGTYLRAFTLPDGVDPNSINAKFDKGLLHVTIQKPAPAAGEEATPAHSISIE